MPETKTVYCLLFCSVLLLFPVSCWDSRNGMTACLVNFVYYFPLLSSSCQVCEMSTFLYLSIVCMCRGLGGVILFMCSHIYTNACWCHRLMLNVFFNHSPSYFLTHGLTASGAHSSSQAASPADPRTRPTSSSPVLALQFLKLHPAFYMPSGELQSGPCACVGGHLISGATSPALSLSVFFFW